MPVVNDKIALTVLRVSSSTFYHLQDQEGTGGWAATQDQNDIPHYDIHYRGVEVNRTLYPDEIQYVTMPLYKTSQMHYRSYFGDPCAEVANLLCIQEGLQ